MLSKYYSDNNIHPYISKQEMFAISIIISRGFSPVAPIKVAEPAFEPSLSTRNLLAVSQNISLYYAPKPDPSLTDITILSISPRQLYIYWNLGEKNSHFLLPSIHSDQLHLRVYAQDTSQGNSTTIFESPIYDIQHKKKITIPVANNNVVYSAYIGNCAIKNKFNSLAKSNELYILKNNSMPGFSSDEYNKSNVDEFIEPIKTTSTSISSQSHYASSNHSGQGIKSLPDE